MSDNELLRGPVKVRPADGLRSDVGPVKHVTAVVKVQSQRVLDAVYWHHVVHEISVHVLVLVVALDGAGAGVQGGDKRLRVQGVGCQAAGGLGQSVILQRDHANVVGLSEQQQLIGLGAAGSTAQEIIRN